MSFLVPVGGCSIGACLPGCEYLHPRPSIAHPAPLCSAPQTPALPVFEKWRLSSRCSSDPVPSVQSGSATDGRDLIHVSVRSSSWIEKTWLLWNEMGRVYRKKERGGVSHPVPFFDRHRSE